MSYYGPTTAREIGADRPPSLVLVLAGLGIRAATATWARIWARISSASFGRGALERQVSRTLSLVTALFLVAIAVRGEAAFAASIPPGQSKASSKTSSTTSSTTKASSKTVSSATSEASPQVPLALASTSPSVPTPSDVDGQAPLGPADAGGGPSPAKSGTAQNLAKRFGGRVQRDALGRWIVDGTLIGLATVNIPGGQDAVFDTTVPAGLTPVELRGHYVVPSSNPNSSLEIGISGGTPQRIESNKNRAFSAPTRLAVAGEGTEYVEFTARTKINASCPDYQPSQLNDLQLVVSGTTQAPVMLADFFPPFLDRLVVRVDNITSKSKAIDEKVAQAVLRLTTFAAQRWPAARVIVSDKSIAMTPYDRQVELRIAEKGTVGLESSRGTTTLVLSGPKSRLVNLAEFLASPALETAFVNSVVTNGQVPSSIELGHVLTIGDLRGRAMIGKGFGSVDQVVTVTQSQLGGQTDSIAVKVTGVAQVAGSGRLVVQLRANEQVLATKRVLNDEPFVLKGVISRSALARDNVIVVRASELSSGTVTAEKLTVARMEGSSAANGAPACGSIRPEVTLQLDPGSQFSATLGRGLPSGFDRFPQALVNGFDVRFAALGLGELQAGSDVVQLLQALSAPRLSPKVFGPNRKHEATRPMIYVGPSSDELTKIDAPIVPEKRRSASVEPISVLQGFAATGDDHLVLVTNGPSSALASTLVSVQADPRGWRSLHGDVVVRQNGRIRNVRIRTSTGNGEEKRRVVLHSRIGYALRVGFGMGMAVALFGALLTKLFGRKHS
jgi:hypothetical protein